MTFETKPDGIYFNLPDTEYHREPRLSASGIGNMLVSPPTFWAASHMNPNREDGDDHTLARQHGRAYHTARLEPEKFDTLYCQEIDQSDYSDARGFLATDTDIKAQLKELGEAQTKAGETVLDRALRLKAAGYPYKIWHIEKDVAEAEYAGRIPIKARYFKDLQRDMEIIHGSPEIAKHLTGGFAEVSVFWTDKKSGVKMKARLDYLKPEQYTDFKTFDNARGKELESKIADDFRYNRYHIQAANYWDACEIIRTTDLPVMDALDAGMVAAEQSDFLVEQIRARKTPLDAWYVFQEKNGIPNLLARQIMLMRTDRAANTVNAAGADDETMAAVEAMTARPSMLYLKAQTEIRHAIGLFKFYMEEVGEDKPWGPLRPTGEINDDSFNPRWLEGDQ